MPRTPAGTKSRLVLYMEPELKRWLEAEIERRKKAGEPTDQSSYVCRLIEGARTEQEGAQA